MEPASPVEEEGRTESAEEGSLAGHRSLPFLRTFLLSTLVLLALLLRLWAIDWGLPNGDRVGSYHPDEAVNLIRGVLDQGRIGPHLDLGFYNYGGLYFYLWQGAIAANGASALVQDPHTAMPAVSATDTFAAMIKVGRLLTAFLGALTVWAIYALGRRLFGNIAGLVGAALYAIMPATVMHGHFATVDVPATFFVAVALVFGAHVLMAEELQIRAVALAGIFCGLAAATKYNCAIVLLAPLAAVFLRRGRGIGTYALLLASALAGFFIGCPGILVNPSGFWSDFRFELVKSGQGAGLLFAGTAPGWLYHITESLRFGLGLPLMLVCLAAVGWAIYRRSRQDWYLLAFLVPYYLVIGAAQVKYLRYVIPVLPVLALLAGRLFEDSLRWRSHLPSVARAVMAACILMTALITLALDRLMAQPTAQDRAYAYITSHVPKGASIGFSSTPWFYSPPLSPMFTAPQPDPVRNRAARAVTDYNLRVPAAYAAWDASVLDPPPDWFILSDIGDTQDAIRLDWKPARPFFVLLRDRYRPVVFENHPTLLGIDLGKPDYAPPDWLYIYPRITLYRRVR